MLNRVKILDIVMSSCNHTNGYSKQKVKKYLHVISLDEAIRHYERNGQSMISLCEIYSFRSA